MSYLSAVIIISCAAFAACLGISAATIAIVVSYLMSC